MGSPRVIKTAELLSRRNYSRGIRSICLMVPCKNALRQRVCTWNSFRISSDQRETSVYRFRWLFRKILCEIDCAKSLDSLTREVDEYFRSSPGKRACAIKPCVNLLSDRTIWQCGVKPRWNFIVYHVGRVRPEESAGQTAIDRTSRRWRVDVGRVIKLPGSLT